MNLSFTQPLQRSWSRMVRMLFRPFVFGKWLTLGFAAFLSEGLGRSWKSGYSWRDHHRGVSPATSEGLHRVAEFLSHPVWGMLVILALSAAFVIILTLLWVNSRGRFIFLDDVVHERSAIVEPWRRFRRHGNSLFVFTIISFLVCAGVLLAVTLPILPGLFEAASRHEWKTMAMLAVGGWLVMLIPLGIVMGYFALFLHQFVVPLMFRHDIGVLAAWSRFFELFGRHPFHFLGFGVVYFLLFLFCLGAGAAVGFATCCIGFALMVTPYVGAVVLLPLEVFFRGFGPDFLAQFGSEYSVFEAPVAPQKPSA